MDFCEFKASLVYMRLNLSEREAELTQRWSFNSSTREVKTGVIMAGVRDEYNAGDRSSDAVWGFSLSSQRIPTDRTNSPLYLSTGRGNSSGWPLCLETFQLFLIAESEFLSLRSIRIHVIPFTSCYLVNSTYLLIYWIIYKFAFSLDLNHEKLDFIQLSNDFRSLADPILSQSFCFYFSSYHYYPTQETIWFFPLLVIHHVFKVHALIS